MLNKQKLIFVALIVAASFYLRFSNISTNFIFGADQSEDLYKVLEIYENIKSGNFKTLPIIGEPGTYSTGHDVSESYPVYSGVFFLYLILPFVVISGFDPSNTVIFFAAVNFLGTFLIYILGKKLFNERAGLIAASLFGTNYYMNVYSRAIWTPSFIPILVMIALYLLIVIKRENKLIFWPPFLFSISAMSQIHDSGYYYMAMFIMMVVFVRPVWPNNLRLKIISLVSFVLPLLPTLVYEIKTNFMLLPSIYKELLIQLNKGNSNIEPWMVVQRLWEFLVSTIYPLSFNGYFLDTLGNLYIPMIILITVVIVMSFASVFSKGAENYSKIIFAVFILSFVFVPIATKIYYADTYFGLYPLFGSTFSTIGAMPLIFLAVAGFLSQFSKKSWKQLLLVTVFLIYILYVNTRGVVNAILFDGDRKYDYGHKVNIIQAIKTNLNGDNYHFVLNDPNSYSEGIEFFYLLYINGLPPPITYNGKSTLVNSFHTYSFTKAVSENRFAVATANGWDFYEQNGWVKLAESGRYKVFKKID